MSTPVAMAGSGRAHLGSTLDPSAGGQAQGVAGHQGGEGLTLGASTSPESVRDGDACTVQSPVREYLIAAINVDMTLNRYLDHDPQGRMYVLENELPRVRIEEAQNAAGRDGTAEPAVSLGLAGDAIQPLTLRVTPGDCLRLRLRNDLRDGEGASIHLHNSGLRVVGGGAAIATNPQAATVPGGTVTYEWMVPPDEPEATHYFHSHVNPRLQSGHGLFGAVVVEPAGSRWLDPRSGAPVSSGWDAIVQVPAGPSFREFALYYHEVGNETYEVTSKSGSAVTLLDPLTGAYRPAGRAVNYRSEPFLNRLALQQASTGTADGSLPYSSYAFGDPATPIMRSYLGDPVKERVIHGGSEVFHVHHVHGGATRWTRQPVVEGSPSQGGLDKTPAVRPRASERTDSQTIGPSETFDVIDECGSGGCQQSAGDFMFHCHVTQHYFSGMWGIWRVYNTLQDGPASTDSLPPLLALPDRLESLSPAVGSDALVGRTIDLNGVAVTVAATALAALVERQLPPRGVPRGYDASVNDWARDGDTYLGEPETDAAWPGYRARAPGQRPPLLFDPRTGRLAYPFLRPHLGKRPPFAPNHGPAPFLDPTDSGAPVPAPGANGSASACPTGTRVKTFALNAIAVPVPINAKAGIVDDAGQIFVLRQQLDAARSNEDLRRPLVLRANAGEDCLDVLLRSDLTDTDDEPLSKVSAHVHFMQFDVQASDGVNAGFNYEQTVRPFRLEGAQLREPANVGATTLHLSDATRFQAGVVLGVGLERERELETAVIGSVDGDVVTLQAPLAYDHQAGETASTEFVRYRWYPDVQFGTAFFHDHANAIKSSRHGLYGAIVSEPPGSTYHDPFSGAEVVSGPIADVRTSSIVSADVTGSFREMVSLMQDDSSSTARGASSGGALNLRAEPLDQRLGDPSRWFSSADHGDPITPLLEAYVGDPLVIRTLVAATNEAHSWHLDGHWFRREAYSSRSPPTNTVAIGVSERFDLPVAEAGGPQAMPGDYLYYSGRSSKLAEGSWGIVRVHEGSHKGLQRLPGHEKAPAPARTVCPRSAPLKRFSVSVIQTPMGMLGGSLGKVYVLDRDVDAIRAGQRPAEPLALHVGVGDCIVVRLTNATDDGPVTFHADMLAADPKDSGVAAGFNPDAAVAPGMSREYRYYAHPDIGETTALVRDWGDVLRNPGLGLYGAIIVGPKGATYRDPVTGQDAGAQSSWRVDVHPRSGGPYRDFAVFLQDEDAAIGTHRMPYAKDVTGTAAINYRSAPLVDGVPAGGDPPTPIMEAAVGDAVHIHVLAPWSEQNQVFSVEGHSWAQEPGTPGSPLVDSVQIGGLEARTMVLEGGAGGPGRLPGDYLYGNHREPFHEAGMWGLLRVSAFNSSRQGSQLLVLDHARRVIPLQRAIALCASAITLALAGAIARRRRRARSRQREETSTSCF